MRLGCKPFQAATERYLESKEGIWGDGTMKENKRKLAYIGTILERLKAEGKLTTTDPRHMVRADIQAFMGWMRRHITPKGQPLDAVAQKKLLDTLKGLLTFYGNHVIMEMKASGVKFPDSPDKGIQTITEEDFQTLLASTGKMHNQWWGEMMRGVLALHMATMVRPSELRGAHFVDLDLMKRTLHVRFPKGGGSWASPEDVAIFRPDLIPVIERYLEARQRHIEEHGEEEAVALFPSYGGRCNGFYSLNQFNRIKRELEEVSGIVFTLKCLRASSASTMTDIDPNLLNSVSGQLRHKDTRTTQRWYAKMSRSRAGRSLEDAWMNRPGTAPSNDSIGERKPIPSQANSPKNPVIRTKFEMTGYG